MAITRKRVSKALAIINKMPDDKLGTMLGGLDTILYYKSGKQRPMTRSGWLHKGKGLIGDTDFNMLEDRIYNAQHKLQATFFDSLWSKIVG